MGKCLTLCFSPQQHQWCNSAHDLWIMLLFLKSCPCIRRQVLWTVSRNQGVTDEWGMGINFHPFILWCKNTTKWKRLSVHVPPAFPKWYSPFAQKSFFNFLLWIERWTQNHYVTSLDVMTSYRDLTWRHDVILWCHMKSHRGPLRFDMGIPFRQKPGNHIVWPYDLDLWPITLTYNPSLAKVKVNPHTKNQGHRSNGSAVRVLTDRDTRVRFYYLDRWRGR